VVVQAEAEDAVILWCDILYVISSTGSNLSTIEERSVEYYYYYYKSSLNTHK